MVIRGVTLKLLKSDWLTIDVVSEAMNQVDSERDYNYDENSTMAIILHNFISGAKHLDNEELAELLEFYANTYHESLEKKTCSMVSIPDDQWKWLQSRANKLNENYEERYFSIDTIAMAAIYDYRGSHFLEESKAMSIDLLAHLQKKDKREYTVMTLFKHDIKALEFISNCLQYFCKPRKISHSDVLSHALSVWINKYVNKDPLNLYLSLENTSERFQRYRGYQLFGWRFGDHEKTKTHYLIKKNTYHSMMHISGLINELDQAVYPVNISVICTDAIRELKKEFLFSPTVTTLKDLNRRRYSIFR